MNNQIHAAILEAKALREKATHGTWKVDGSDIWKIGESYDSKEDPHVYTGIEITRELRGGTKAQANLALCAHAANNLTSICDYALALEAENAVLRGKVQDALFEGRMGEVGSTDELLADWNDSNTKAQLDALGDKQ